MKFLVILSLTVVCAVAAPQQRPEPPIAILRMDHQDDHEGQYNLNFETANGITHSQSGQLKDLGGTEGPVQVSQGSYSYMAPDGQTYSVQWTSDERGFIATGAHLPTSPPLPEAIQRSLAERGQEDPRMVRNF